MKQLYGVGVVALTFSQLAAADPPPCQKWKQYTTDCEILGKPPGCTVNGVEHEQVNRERFSYSAKQACKKYLKIKYPMVGNKFETWPINDTTARCVWDVNNDGQINDSDASQAGVLVDFVTITPEDHCFCTVTNGPYKDVMWSGSLGSTVFEAAMVVLFHAFPKDLKTAILQDNFTSNGNSYKSDAPFDSNQTLQKQNLYEEDAAEIDHIIPRVDSQGCLCGDPKPENAAVISRELNAKMSNTSPKYDLNRSKMYKEFGVTCTNPDAGKFAGFVPIIPGNWNFGDFDETSYGIELDREEPPRTHSAPFQDTTSSGGCNTSRGGGLGIGLALLLVLRRRATSCAGRTGRASL